MLILILDTETNGLPKNQKVVPNILNCHNWPNIVQFSYLLYDTDFNKILVKSDHIIRVPKGVIISTQSTSIHGITNEISEEKGIPIEEVLHMFFEDFKKAHLIVAHNVDFDKKFIIAEILKLSSSQTDLLNMITVIAHSKKYYCTMKEGTDLCKIKSYTKIENKEYIKFPTLTELCNHLFHYKPKNMHNSMNDVIICFQCFYKMTFRSDICEKNSEIFEMVRKMM